MKNLDYKKLIEENKVYYIKYGRGAVIGVACESLKDSFETVYGAIKESHIQDPTLIRSIEFIDDFVIFDIIVRKESGFYRECEYEYKITKQIPLSQITFENYQVNT